MQHERKKKHYLLEFSETGCRQKQSVLSLSAMLQTIQQREAVYSKKEHTHTQQENNVLVLTDSLRSAKPLSHE